MRSRCDSLLLELNFNNLKRIFMKISEAFFIKQTDRITNLENRSKKLEEGSVKAEEKGFEVVSNVLDRRSDRLDRRSERGPKSYLGEA